MTDATDDLKTWLLEQHQKALLDGVAMGQQHERARIVKELEELKTEYLLMGQHMAVGIVNTIIEGLTGKAE